MQPYFNADGDIDADSNDEDIMMTVLNPVLTGVFRAKFEEIHLEMYFFFPDLVISCIFGLFILVHFSCLSRS